MWHNCENTREGLFPCVCECCACPSENFVKLAVTHEVQHTNIPYKKNYSVIIGVFFGVMAFICDIIIYKNYVHQADSYSFHGQTPSPASSYQDSTFQSIENYDDVYKQLQVCEQERQKFLREIDIMTYKASMAQYQDRLSEKLFWADAFDDFDREERKSLAITIAFFAEYNLIHHKDKLQWSNAKFIFVDKQELKLHVFNFNGKEEMCVPCAVGKNAGNKISEGDMRTPEGVFFLKDKQNSSAWLHDFGDGKGKIEGAYGPRFLRLDVPGHKGIGIHGTHLPETIGTRASEGCIRLRNDDIMKLSDLVSIPCVVIIAPGYEDALVNVKHQNINPENH